MPRARQTVAPHPSVILLLVSGLSERCQPDDHIAGAYTCIINHIAATHAAGNRTVDDDRAYQIADVGRFTTGGIDAYAHIAQLVQQLVRAVDNG